MSEVEILLRSIPAESSWS